MGRLEKITIKLCIVIITMCLSIMGLYVYFVNVNEKNNNEFRLLTTDEFIGEIIERCSIIYAKGMELTNNRDDKAEENNNTVLNQETAEEITVNTKSNIDELKDINGLIRVDELNDNFAIELRYASEENFARQRIYKKAVCLLRRETAKKLIAANREFNKKGYRIKIWDAYRPHYIQSVLYELAVDKEFIANPTSGSKHNRGAAVDITLVDKNGVEIDMPTGFDEFTPRASLNYKGMTDKQKENVSYMKEVMERHGFSGVGIEWWHFNDNDWEKYPLLNIKLEDVKI